MRSLVVVYVSFSFWTSRETEKTTDSICRAVEFQADDLFRRNGGRFFEYHWVTIGLTGNRLDYAPPAFRRASRKIFAI